MSGINDAGFGLYTRCNFEPGWLLMEYDGYVYPAGGEADTH